MSDLEGQEELQKSRAFWKGCCFTNLEKGR